MRGIYQAGAVGCWLALAAWLVLPLSGCRSTGIPTAVYPAITGAHVVGSAECVDCHSEISRRFVTNPHSRILDRVVASPGQSTAVGCEVCHGPGSRHVEVGGGRREILNPRRDATVCFQCHQGVEAELRLPSHHPVLEGNMNCVDCHDPHGNDRRKGGRRSHLSGDPAGCARCHQEQSRLRVFEHEALREGCTVCHSPHGSSGSHLLRERDANLCLKCHAQVPGPGAGGELYIGKVAHTGFIRQGTCWSAGCHTAVHGSNVSPRLFY